MLLISSDEPLAHACRIGLISSFAGVSRRRLVLGRIK